MEVPDIDDVREFVADTESDAPNDIVFVDVRVIVLEGLRLVVIVVEGVLVGVTSGVLVPEPVELIVCVGDDVNDDVSLDDIVGVDNDDLVTLGDSPGKSSRGGVSEAVGKVVCVADEVPVGDTVALLLTVPVCDEVPDFVADGDAVRVVVVDLDEVPDVEGVFDIEAPKEPVGVGVTAIDASLDFVEVTVFEGVDDRVGESEDVIELVGVSVPELVPEGVESDVFELVIEILDVLLGEAPVDKE